MNPYAHLEIRWCLIMMLPTPILTHVIINVRFMEQRHVTLKLIRKLRLLFRQCSEVRTVFLALTVSWLRGDQEISVLSTSRSSRGDVFQHGMDKWKTCFVLWIERIQALYPWGKGDHTWSWCISKLHIVCPAFWTGGILSLAVTRASVPVQWPCG